MKVKIIIGSVREGRSGDKIARWVYDQVSKNKDIEYEVLDLKEWQIPYYPYELPPAAMETYTDPLQKKWAEKIAEADGFILVTAEYNRGPAPALKAALDFVYTEWNNKPVAFVSYGNIAAGTRAVEQLRLSSIELQMAPIREGVHIPLIWEALDENGKLKEEERFNETLASQQVQLNWWMKALKEAREDSKK